MSAPAMSSEIDTATPGLVTSDTSTPRATTPEEWVAGFAAGWRALDGPDAFTARFRRESYYGPTPLLAMLARTPRSWPRFARLRAARLSEPLTARAAR